jgi:K+-transporting ATPase ATPase C chain
MFQQLRTAIVLLILVTILTGAIYPAVVTVIAQTMFNHQANGSLIHNEGELIGSELIGQSFSRTEYFWGRLSATQPFPYNAAASSGSNYGPLHPALESAAKERIAQLRANNPDNSLIPVDLVTSSASGLDPHITPAAAKFQIARVAAARKMPEDTIRQLVDQYTEGRQFGVLGEPRVNVLQLNLALDQTAATR